MSCVTRELLLEDLDPDEAWDAVLDMEAWLAEEADLELEPGAEGHFRFDDGSERRALVEEVDPGRALSWWWWSDDADDLGTRVEVRLVEAVAGTRVVVVEEGFAVGPVALALGGLARLPLAA
ncbi:MAG TPA: SRPBCC domain-containing protein [Solirubrobacteraceae bacterium]